MKEVIIKRVTEASEIKGIKALQEANLKRSLPEGEADTQGFVTAVYTLDFLKEMNKASPSVVAISGDEIVGYALVTVPAVSRQHPLLKDLFHTIDQTTYKGDLLKGKRYVVVGQLCVAKEYRGLGVVDKLYQHFKEALRSEYDFCITDVAQSNPRSLKAHLNAGFQVIETLGFEGVLFDLVLWDWRV